MLKIILLAIAGIYLYHDYIIDKGQHIKAKIINGIFIGLITIMYADSFRYIGWMIREPNKIKEIWYSQVGIIPESAHLIINFSSVIIGITLIFFASKMTRRDEFGRISTLRLLPLIAAIEVFSFYRGWISDGNDSTTNQIFALLIGTILIGGLCFLIFRIYRSQFMNDFFSRKNLIPIENKNRE
jgi:hypothetical protein